MYYADYHVHTRLSPDGRDTMARTAAQAASYGLSEVCFTDHVDMIDFDGQLVTERSLDDLKRDYTNALLQSGTQLRLRLGMELGETRFNLPLARALASDPELDFIIGSIHRASDERDYYVLRYSDPVFCRTLLDDYMDQLEYLAALDCFDVLGHITYPLRYMKDRDGQDVGFEPYRERLETLFRSLISRGKGIEVNVSNLRRSPQGETMPPLWLLELYRTCGGEIITIGSDAHNSGDVGAFVPRACDLLIYVGFRYYTVYEKHVPNFIKLV